MSRQKNMLCIAGLVLMTHACAEELDHFPTDREIQTAFAEAAKNMSQQWRLFRPMVKSVKMWRHTATPEQIHFAEDFIISNILSTTIGTTSDANWIKYDVLGKDLCMREIVQWDTIYFNTNLLFRIADDLSRYEPLPHIGKDARTLASQLDHLVEFGTNTPPRNVGLRCVNGQFELMILRMSDFRVAYNKRISEYRLGVGRIVHRLILYDKFPTFRDGERIKLWDDFSNRAKFTGAERSMIVK